MDDNSPAAHAAAAVARLRELSRPERLAGMARYGIATHAALGVSIPELRGLARELTRGRDAALAAALWETGLHEARILSSMVDDPVLATPELLEVRGRDFGSWDLCDQCCANFIEKTALAWDLALDWSGREELWLRRAGFVLMARLAVSDKKAQDERFQPFFEAIRTGCADPRNYVKKAVNWALRQMGKRNPALNAQAVALAEELRRLDAPAARWIAADALRELTSEAVQARLRAKQSRGAVKV